MHEASLARRIIEIAESRAKLHGILSVKSVKVRVGRWAGVNVDQLRRAFTQAANAGATAGARLDVELVEPVCRCEDCGAVFDPQRFTLRCAHCGSAKVVLRQGRELEVVGIEV